MSALAFPPFALPVSQLSRNEAQARTVIAQRGGGLAFSIGAPWSARLRPLAAAETLPGPAWSARFEWAGAAFVLEMPAPAAAQALETLLGDASLPTLPPAMALAAVEGALGEVLDTLQSLGRGTPALLSVGDEAAPALPHGFALLLQAADGVHAIDARLSCDSLGLLVLAGLLQRRPPQAGPAAAQLPLALPVELGFSHLSLDEFRGLEAGDVVALAASHLGADRNLWVTADGRAGFSVALTDTLTVTRPWTDSMPDSLLSDALPEAAASLEQLPVRLSFDLGELRLTLAELRALQPGQVLELGRPIQPAVQIRANGALVGEGELVSVDGQLGVSVSTLFAGKGA